MKEEKRREGEKGRGMKKIEEGDERRGNRWDG